MLVRPKLNSTNFRVLYARVGGQAIASIEYSIDSTRRLASPLTHQGTVHIYLYLGYLASASTTLYLQQRRKRRRGERTNWGFSRGERRRCETRSQPISPPVLRLQRYESCTLWTRNKLRGADDGRPRRQHQQLQQIHETTVPTYIS